MVGARKVLLASNTNLGPSRGFSHWIRTTTFQTTSPGDTEAWRGAVPRPRPQSKESVASGSLCCHVGPCRGGAWTPGRGLGAEHVLRAGWPAGSRSLGLLAHRSLMSRVPDTRGQDETGNVVASLGHRLALREGAGCIPRLGLCREMETAPGCGSAGPEPPRVTEGLLPGRRVAEATRPRVPSVA